MIEELVSSKKIVPLHDKRDPLFGNNHPEPIEKFLAPLAAAVVPVPLPAAAAAAAMAAAAVTVGMRDRTLSEER